MRFAAVSTDGDKDGDKERIFEVSCYNAPDSVAVSLFDALVALAQTHAIFAQRIRTLVPGHFSFMDAIQPIYLSKMYDIFALPAPHTQERVAQDVVRHREGAREGAGVGTQHYMTPVLILCNRMQTR
jgi:hypothetical protein